MKPGNRWRRGKRSAAGSNPASTTRPIVAETQNKRDMKQLALATALGMLSFALMVGEVPIDASAYMLKFIVMKVTAFAFGAWAVNLTKRIYL